MTTKIIATIGPSSSKTSVLKKMINEGMNIARINTKHASKDFCIDILKNLKKIRKCEVLIDIKELKPIEWIKKNDFDYLAVSFANSGAQIKKIRKLLHPKKIKIISKIETKKGMKNINQIIQESNGIMIARGDLGKNVSFEKVPLMQKLIIKQCNKKKKIAITATEMLLSLVKSKYPSRADASDIANAVLDGSDALMLSEETAIGKYPVLAVKTMKKIIKETEKTRHLLL